MRVCAVKGCTSNAQRLFEMPIKDKKRLPVWLSATGNQKLLRLNLKQLKAKFICQLHFEEKYFMLKKLSTTAVPTLNLASEPLEVPDFRISDVRSHENFSWNPKDWPTHAEASVVAVESTEVDTVSDVQQRCDNVGASNESRHYHNSAEPSESDYGKGQSDEHLISPESKKRKSANIHSSSETRQRSRKHNFKKSNHLIYIHKVVKSKLLCSRIPRKMMKGKINDQIVKIQHALNHKFGNQMGLQWIQLS